MPDTPVTREQLLASVHELHAGDLLVVRVQRTDVTQQQVANLAAGLAENKPDGVRILVFGADVAIEVVRPGDKASDLTEAVERATANPGQVVEVQS
jgi:hypothetical protein